MAISTIPVDLLNPGQVFACLGFLEAADHLLGNASGWFQCGEQACFHIECEGTADPIETTLIFLVEADCHEVAPSTWEGNERKTIDRLVMRCFPNNQPKETELPVLLKGCVAGRPTEVMLSHWCDGSSREHFKLYAGNRSAFTILKKMIAGDTGKNGRIKSTGLHHLLASQYVETLSDPFNVLGVVAGSFNFDPRGGWTSIDVGFSPNDLKGQLEVKVSSSPLVEIMAAWGLEYVRPALTGHLTYQYSVWSEPASPSLARSIICTAIPGLETHRFHFPLFMSGKNKVIGFATEEPKK
jgi:CRISPR-associated protein Csx14